MKKYSAILEAKCGNLLSDLQTQGVDELETCNKKPRLHGNAFKMYIDISMDRGWLARVARCSCNVLYNVEGHTCSRRPNYEYLNMSSLWLTRMPASCMAPHCLGTICCKRFSQHLHVSLYPLRSIHIILLMLPCKQGFLLPASASSTCCTCKSDSKSPHFSSRIAEFLLISADILCLQN